MKQSGRTLLGLVLVLLLLMLFVSTAAVALHPLTEKKLLPLALLLVAFLFSLGFTVMLTQRVFTKFAQHLYDIAPEEASALVQRLIFGGVGPTLQVQEGRVHPDGAAILQQVGGPGELRIAHDSAVVTQRVARLHRVLGPGLHTLEPFEKVWDVIDLRWQRRSVHLELMTRDGLPVYCDADIRFRVEGGPRAGGHAYAYSEPAVLGLAALKRVVAADAAPALQDWPERVVELLIAEMRNVLEAHSLDEFLNPRYGLPQAPAPLPEPRSLLELEQRIAAAVGEAALAMGVTVDSVKLGPVLPSEGAISQQWLEFWRARMQRLMDENAIEGDAIYANLILQAQVNAKVELVTTMLNEVAALSQGDVAVPSELIVLSFVDALRAIARRDPATQQVMLSQAEKLMHILQEL